MIRAISNDAGVVTAVMRSSVELREGYESGKSLHDIVVVERKLLMQQKWDEVFSFENLISPKFEQ